MVYLLSDSENIAESSDPAKNSKGIGRITYVIAAREQNTRCNSKQGNVLVILSHNNPINEKIKIKNGMLESNFNDALSHH